uniref:Arabidopsis retrotransposon Orf1 C-terminal domain-containing protein n=1 Tax=Noccaea caerulescens TaxID=107243 RepID=A0A1J3JBV2_NOCCA
MRNAELAYEQGKIKDSYLAIGSMITPILLATNVPLPAPTHPPQFMDIAYLNKTWFLRGMHNGKHVYRFEHPTFGVSKILLPNKELTSHNTRAGIIFLPTAHQLFMDGGDATVNEEQGNDEGEPSESQASGHDDFDFIPYNASGSAPAIVKAHEHIRLLHKGFKKQAELIKKLTETVNVLKAKLSCTSPKATETVEPVLRRSRRKRRTGGSPPPTSFTQPIDLDETPTPPDNSP